MGDGDDVACEVGGVCVGREVVFIARAFEAVAEGVFSGGAARDEVLADGFGIFTAGEGALDSEASARVAWIGEEFDGVVEDVFDDGAGGWLEESAAGVRRGALGVAVHCLAEEGFLVSEGGVEAGAVDAHGLGEVVERCAFVSAAPEDAQGTVERFVEIELTGTSHLRRGPPSLPGDTL